MTLAGKASVESGGQKPLRVKSGKSRVRMKPGLGVEATFKAYYYVRCSCTRSTMCTREKTMSFAHGELRAYHWFCNGASCSTAPILPLNEAGIAEIPSKCKRMRIQYENSGSGLLPGCYIHRSQRVRACAPTLRCLICFA